MSQSDVQFYLTNGKVARFTVETGWIMENVHPNKLFSQPQIVVATPSSLAAFPSHHVALVDIATERQLGWAFPPEVSDIRLVSVEYFLEQTQNIRTDRPEPPKAGESAKGHVVAELAGVEPLHLEYSTIVRGKLDQRMVVNQLLSQPALLARREDDKGMTLLNIANLARLTFYPGPPERPTTAWPAQSV
ncbi:MAG: hypothetical protein K1X53_16165 [Candidatus Sumerlaeaceae bacterium]|nr:hypothetical protein [Candidatus Sumerlaeaceae bacterium]